MAEHTLDVARLHHGLQLHFGLDPAYLSSVSSTALTYLLAPNGLPMHVGWFDNSNKTLAGPNCFALTTYPEEPRNTHHRLLVTQYPTQNGTAWLIEEDASDYLEGDADRPATLRHEPLAGADLEGALRTHVTGAYVVNATLGHQLEQFAWHHDYDVPAVRQYGLDIITLEDLVTIDAFMLDRFAAQEPPALQ